MSSFSGFLGRWKCLLLILALLVAPVRLALHTEVRAGFHTSSLVLTTREFCLNVTIFSGGSQVVAGEFNVSYPSECSLVKVEGGREWIVIPTGRCYVFYTLSGAPNETVVAVLHFKLNEPSARREFNISLEYFKAADSRGRDLGVVIDPSVVSVLTQAATPPAPPPPAAEVARTRDYRGWVLVAAIAVAAAIVLLSLYLRVQALPGYYLLDERGRVVFSGRGRDHVYGREDFAGLIPSQSLGYITRRSKGGQFRIFIHDNTYYIEDNYSRNPTLLDGASIRGRGPIPLREGCSISIPGVLYLVFRRAGRR